MKTRPKFTRPFCLVEFNRSNERQAYLFFRSAKGSLTEASVGAKLENGVQVPMLALARAYSEIKLYDHEPPLPYTLQLIWEHIVNAKASESPKYTTLKKGQHVIVPLSLGEVVKELHEKFSFRQLHAEASERQPAIPEADWVRRAFDKLVQAGDAEWLDRTSGALLAKFTRRDDVLTHFVDICVGDEEAKGQLPLFKEDGQTSAPR